MLIILANKDEYGKIAEKIVYTGAIDAYFDFQLGALEYRSVRFETELLDQPEFSRKCSGELYRCGDSVDPYH